MDYDNLILYAWFPEITVKATVRILPWWEAGRESADKESRLCNWSEKHLEGHNTILLVQIFIYFYIKSYRKNCYVQGTKQSARKNEKKFKFTVFIV